MTGRGRSDRRGALAGTLYDRAAVESAAVVIQRFSSSFGLASRLLAQPVRSHVSNVYALVRVADEVVDSTDTPVTDERRAELLAALEEETYAALRTGHSANLVVHAFALTARECGIGPELIGPFFASMAMDLAVTDHDEASFARYVYGSAEVVGLMCLRVFLSDPGPGAAEPQSERRYAELAPGARCLGSAFQKVNFVRDLAADHDRLGRSYFPGLDVTAFSTADRDRLLDDIDADLAAAGQVVHQLPPSSRRAVAAAHAVFTELSRRLRLTPPQTILTDRVRVPAPVKARLVAAAWTGGRR